MESLKKCQLSSICLYNIVILVAYFQYASTGDCPADGRTWVPYGQRCYLFVHGEDLIQSYTFETAKSLCQGFELVTIESAEENNFVITYSPEVWKGNIHVWLGMYYDTDSEDMKWFGEKSVSFSNWENSSVSDLAPIDTCVVLHSSTGKWENVSCLEEVENGVVCEAAETVETSKQKASSLLSALVTVSVLAIIGISAAIWFIHQKHNISSSVLTSFEYHTPFRSPSADETYLVDTEEVDDLP
ncbi:CD302 antigen isoform 2-T2 [Aplochiton taeniatus]